MPAATADEVKGMIAAQIGKVAGASALEAFWDVIVPVAMEDAESYIRGRLEEKGATAEQIAKSRRFHSWHLRQSCFLAGAYRFADLSDAAQSALDRLNITAELDALTTIDGQEFGPDSGKSIRAGQLTAGVFNRPFVGRCGLPAGPFAGENRWQT